MPGLSSRASCPCGSGRSFLECCSSARFGPGRQGLVLRRLRFEKDPWSENSLCWAEGFVTEDRWIHPFRGLLVFNPVTLSWTADPTRFQWNDPVPLAYREQRGKQPFVGALENCFQPHWVVVTVENDGRYVPRLGRGIQNFWEAQWATVSFRERLAQHYRPNWTGLWDRILNRAEADPEFCARGFSRSQLREALANLKGYFSPAWFKRHCLGTSSRSVRSVFWKEVPAVGFPAHDLVACGLGILNRDPSLNGLVTLGLYLPRLRRVQGYRWLRPKLTTAEGVHLGCLLGRLHQQGVLRRLGAVTLIEWEGRPLEIAFEPTGAGVAGIPRIGYVPADSGCSSQEQDWEGHAHLDGWVVARMYIERDGGPVRWYCRSVQSGSKLSSGWLRQLFEPEWDRRVEPVFWCPDPGDHHQQPGAQTRP